MVTVIIAFYRVMCEIKVMHGIVGCKISPYSTFKSAIKALELAGCSEIDNTVFLHQRLFVFSLPASQCSATFGV